MKSFTRQKFLNLTLLQQHKMCAELLKTGEEMVEYEQLCLWMGLPIPKTSEEIADCYHRHLKASKTQLKEHRLLSIRTRDRDTAEPAWPIAVYLDNLRSAHNVGSVVRTTEALSLGSLHFSPSTPFIDNKQVKDAAMGAEAWVDCHPNSDLKDLPRPIIVMETSEDATPLYDFHFPESFTLVLGNEEYGCSQASILEADHLVEIPLRGRKNSLNVANAFAITAAEIYRQRRSLS